MSIYDGVGFSYSLRASDATEIPPDEADILDARDRQLNSFTTTLKNQVSAALAGKLEASIVVFGSAVVTLPAVAGAVIVNHGGDLSGYTNKWVVVTNGDYAANKARFAAGTVTATDFDLYHEGGGTVGNLARVNFIAYGA